MWTSFPRIPSEIEDDLNDADPRSHQAATLAPPLIVQSNGAVKVNPETRP